MSNEGNNKHNMFSPFSLKGLLTDISLLMVIGLLFSGYAGHLNPNTWSWLSLAGYAFPIFLAGTVATLAVCLLTKKSVALIPFAGLLLAYTPVTLYCPIHLKADTTPKEGKDTLTILSYNTFNWAIDNTDLPTDSITNPIVEYIVASDADIVCLQESTLSIGSPVREDIDSLLRPQYEHIDSVCNDKDASATLLSRYPIKRKQLIDYKTEGNVSAAFWLDINGREVIVMNCHLQTMGLSMEVRKDFGRMMHGKDHDSHSIKSTSRTIIGKIHEASRKRAGQAEAVARFLRANCNTPIILCGDFNDIPHSYTYNTIANPGKGVNGETVEMTNCYRDAGLGPGYSYNRFAIHARIDNILCTAQHFTPYYCKTDNSTGVSDHYPVICRLYMK